MSEHSESDAHFAHRLRDLDSFAAATLLLRSGLGEGGTYVDLYAGAHFEAAEPIISPLGMDIQGSFESINRVSLRDNAPGNGPRRPKSSTLHQFVLREEVASPLNEQLRHDATDESRGEGVRVSNVGGFHSASEIFDPAHDGAWHSSLTTVLVEALHAVNEDGRIAGSPIDQLHLRGWLNVSSPACFNRPHDHGAIALSAVYFACCDGGSPASPLPQGWTCGTDPSSGRPFYYNSAQQLSQWEAPSGEVPCLARCAGELIFQTQQAAWRNRYGIFSVAPVPGTLWLFPAYMPHCTLPRTLQASEMAWKSSAARSG